MARSYLGQDLGMFAPIDQMPPSRTRRPEPKGAIDMDPRSMLSCNTGDGR